MKTPTRPASWAIHDQEKQRQVALFKTSLRDWKARYQTPRGSQAPVSEKIPSQTAPA